MEDKTTKKDDKYLDYIPDENDNAEELDQRLSKVARKNQNLTGITGSKDLIEETMLGGPTSDPMEGMGHQKITDREGDY